MNFDGPKVAVLQWTSGSVVFQSRGADSLLRLAIVATNSCCPMGHIARTGRRPRGPHWKLLSHRAVNRCSSHSASFCNGVTAGAVFGDLVEQTFTKLATRKKQVYALTLQTGMQLTQRADFHKTC